MSADKKKKVETSENKLNQKKKKVRSKKSSKVDSQLTEIIEKLAKSEDRHLRLAAEFDNYRRRKDKEVSQMLQYEGRGIFESLLPVIDDLDRLVDVFNEQGEDKNNSSITEGINLIQTKMKNFLEEWNLSSYGSSGDILDSNIHDAITVQKEKGKKEDEVLQVFQKGYRY